MVRWTGLGAAWAAIRFVSRNVGRNLARGNRTRLQDPFPVTCYLLTTTISVIPAPRSSPLSVFSLFFQFSNVSRSFPRFPRTLKLRNCESPRWITFLSFPVLEESFIEDFFQRSTFQCSQTFWKQTVASWINKGSSEKIITRVDYANCLLSTTTTAEKKSNAPRRRLVPPVDLAQSSISTFDLFPDERHDKPARPGRISGGVSQPV